MKVAGTTRSSSDKYLNKHKLKIFLKKFICETKYFRRSKIWEMDKNIEINYNTYSNNTYYTKLLIQSFELL